MIGVSALSDDDDGKHEGLLWKLAESVRLRNNIFTASPLTSFSKCKIRFFQRILKILSAQHLQEIQIRTDNVSG